MATGVAKKPLIDLEAYREDLSRFVFRSGFLMKPLFAKAKADPKRVIYAEGEDERVLRAAQVAIEEGMAIPILIGRPSVIETRVKRFVSDTLCQVCIILSLIFRRTQCHVTREDVEVQGGQNHIGPGKASPALCASKLKPIDLSV